MNKEESDILKVVAKLEKASELEVVKNCEYTHRKVHFSLRALKRYKHVDTDDNGSYFVVSK